MVRPLGFLLAFLFLGGCSPPTATLVVDLSLQGPAPLDLEVSSSGVDLDCVALEERIRCESEIATRRDVRVTVKYRAIDGRWESAHQDLRVRGDEEEIVLRGSFDGDASLPGLRSWTYRRADPRIALEAVAPPLGPGEPPFFEFTNGSDAPVEVQAQVAVLGHIVRVEDDTWQPTPRAWGGGCGTGSGPTVIAPGVRAPVGEVYPLGGPVPLPRGPYSFVVEFEDAGARSEERASRRVTARFDVTETALAKAGFSLGELLATRPRRASPPTTLWTRAPSRPGLERPRGTEGSQLAGDAPTLSNGETIAGALSPDRSRHAYRLPFAHGEEAVVRIFARCKQSPCSTQIGMYWGRERELQGHTRWLHRDPPAWSMHEDTFRARGAERVLVIGCREECDAEWEFHGRVLVRARAAASE